MGQCPTISILKNISSLFVLIGICIQASGQGMKCSGYCTKDTMKCQLRGGKIIGYCSKSLMCCDPLVSATGTCGDKKSGQKVVFFNSPSYPDYAGGDLLCELKVRVRNDTKAIRIDFMKVEMDGLSFDGAGENTASCESDMLFIRGFQTWSPPPRCGNLTGYGVLIDMDTKQSQNLGMLSIIALMSSPKYRFRLRISQLTKNSGAVWDVKESFIEKRSVPPQMFSTGFTESPNPTKILIKTESSINLDNFRNYDYQHPSRSWKTPSVINGEDTIISTVPWQVSLRVKPPTQPMTDFSDLTMSSSTPVSNLDSTTEDMTVDNSTEVVSNCSGSEGIHFCGGSIFGDGRHILSSAHCFFGSSKVDGMLNISSIMVVVGDTNKCSDEDEWGIFSDKESRLKSYRYDVESVIFHYGYDHSLLLNDVAILRLNETIKYYDHVKPITLANAGDIFDGKQALLSGWGDRYHEGDNSSLAIEEPSGPDILQSTKLLEIQRKTFCNERELSQLAAPKAQVLSHSKYSYYFDSTICTLAKNGSEMEANTGPGDSGGPLVAFVNETHPVLVGVVSYSIQYDDKTLLLDGVNRTVDFYASVAFYRNWIDLAIKSLHDASTKA